MDSDHYLRFVKYIDTLGPSLDAAGYPIRYMLLVSSAFGGRDGERHPFHARATALKDDRQVSLAYLSADILARIAVQVELAELSPRDREALNWNGLLATGLVEASAVDTEIGL
ncbi:hypothetical protein QQ44_01340 [Mycolicibacterium setense]|uniref:Uncharacterized protein n=2 Tax=Mycolicibacterium setense TaxID=431269 RepID=A0ABR4Z1D2_9MYCO|nr:hypothetical protein QQ44_01340 [Mycolicibacterium setense]